MSDKPSPITRAQCTHDQRRCWDTLAKVIHLDRQHVYPCGDGIRTSIFGEAATHDSRLLTWLVLLAHRDCVRIAITSAGPRRIGITAHPRDPMHIVESAYRRRAEVLPPRETYIAITEGHPSLDDLIARAQAIKPPEPTK